MRFNVGRHVLDLGSFHCQKGVFYGMGDFVSCLNRNAGIHLDVDVDEEMAPASADNQGLYFLNALNSSNTIEDEEMFFILNAAVHQFIKGRADDLVGIIEDEECDQTGGNIVRVGQALTTEDRNDYAKKDAEGCQGITPVVPGFGTECTAVMMLSSTNRQPVKQFLDQDDADESGNGKSSRYKVWS